MIFVDSSFILALFNQNDVVNHNKVKVLLNAVPEINNVPKAINNIVLNEVLNKLKKSYYRNQREDIINFLLNMDEIYFVNRETYKKALALYRKYDYEINYSDLLIILSMKEHGITDIISFDSDFNKIKDINNIYI